MTSPGSAKSPPIQSQPVGRRLKASAGSIEYLENGDRSDEEREPWKRTCQPPRPVWYGLIRPAALTLAWTIDGVKRRFRVDEFGDKAWPFDRPGGSRRRSARGGFGGRLPDRFFRIAFDRGGFRRPRPFRGFDSSAETIVSQKSACRNHQMAQIPPAASRRQGGSASSESGALAPCRGDDSIRAAAGLRLRKKGPPPASSPLKFGGKPMIVATTENVAGHCTVQTLGQCFGVVVRSRGWAAI